MQAGRRRSDAAVASKPVPPPLSMDSDDLSSTCDGIPTSKRRRHRRRKKRRRRRGDSAVANVANVGDVGGSESVEELAVSHHVKVQEVDGGSVPSVAHVAVSQFAGWCDAHRW